MKNIIHELPAKNLHGRLDFSVKFVADKDIKGKTILDIGCGYGWCELNFLKRNPKKIIATEVAMSDLSTIKKNIKNSKITFQVANAIKLPFNNRSVDTIVCWEVIEHIPLNTENKMFSEFNRVLKPGGMCYLSTPFRSAPAMIFDPAWWLIGHRHYSLSQLKRFARDSGFLVKAYSIKGKWWEIFNILNMYFSKWVLRRSPIFSNLFIEKVNKEYAEELGFVDIFMKFQKNA